MNLIRTLVASDAYPDIEYVIKLHAGNVEGEPGKTR